MGRRHYDPFQEFFDKHGDVEDDGVGSDVGSTRRVKVHVPPKCVDIQVEKVVGESPKAIQCVLEETGDVKWFPKSVIHANSEVYQMDPDGDTGGTLIVQEWFAKKEGYI